MSLYLCSTQSFLFAFAETSRSLCLSVNNQAELSSVEFLPDRQIAPKKEPFWRRRATALILLGIILIAGFFRFYGRDFDQGHNQHPDERFIVGKTLSLNWPSSAEQFGDVLHSPLNLRNVDNGGPCPPPGCNYPYGALPVYLVKGAGWLYDTVVPHPQDEAKDYYHASYDGITKTGRSLAAIFDLITILLVFLIGRRLYSSAVGLIAAALVAFAVTHIQIAHFYASDVFLVTFMMGALYCSVVLMQRPSWRAALGAGLFIGLAVATKVSVVPFAVVVVMAVILRTAYRKRTRLLAAELGDPVGFRPATQRERNMSAAVHFGRGFLYLIGAG